jgi:hypothetical protein
MSIEYDDIVKNDGARHFWTLEHGNLQDQIANGLYMVQIGSGMIPVDSPFGPGTGIKFVETGITTQYPSLVVPEFDWSFDCWVRMPNPGTDTGWDTILCFGTHGWQIRSASVFNGKISVAVSAIEAVGETIDNVLGDMLWHHLMVTKNTNVEFKLYIDGVLDSTFAYTGNAVINEYVGTHVANADLPSLELARIALYPTVLQDSDAIAHATAQTIDLVPDPMTTDWVPIWNLKQS